MFCLSLSLSVSMSRVYKWSLACQKLRVELRPPIFFPKNEGGRQKFTRTTGISRSPGKALSLSCLSVSRSLCPHLLCLQVELSPPNIMNLPPKHPAKIMACGTRTPVVVWRSRTAVSTFFSCAALFYGMLAKVLYSVGTLLNMKL